MLHRVRKRIINQPNPSVFLGRWIRNSVRSVFHSSQAAAPDSEHSVTCPQDATGAVSCSKLSACHPVRPLRMLMPHRSYISLEDPNEKLTSTSRRIRSLARSTLISFNGVSASNFGDSPAGQQSRCSAPWSNPGFYVRSTAPALLSAC